MPALAELECQKRIDLTATGYIGEVVGPAAVKSVVDICIAAPVAAKGGPPGWIIGGVLAVDSAVGAAVTVRNTDKIKKAADQAKQEYCNCGCSDAAEKSPPGPQL